MYQFSSVQLLSHVLLFATPWTTACQVSLPITNSQSLLKLMSIVSVMQSNHLTFCHPFLLLPSILPSIRVFSNELVLCIRWLKSWSFSFSISPSNEYSALVSFRFDWLDLLAVQGTLKSLLQHHSDDQPNWSRGPQPCLSQWNHEPSCVGPPKTDRSWWRVLTKPGKGMANNSSILALRAPWTVWKGNIYIYIFFFPFTNLSFSKVESISFIFLYLASYHLYCTQYIPQGLSKWHWW